MQRRTDLEKDKRKMQSEMSDLQDKLNAALQRIQDLEAIKSRLEKELAAMTHR